MKKLLTLVLLMGALFIAIQPEAKTPDKKKVVMSEIYQQINAYRAEHGLPALEISKNLERSADGYADKLQTRYSNRLQHDQAWINRKRKPSAELLACAADPVTAWQKSHRHNNLLLSSRYTSMGLGVNKTGTYVLRIMQK